VKISKTEFLCSIYLESKYNKTSKFEEVMVHINKKMSGLNWNKSARFLVCNVAYFPIAHGRLYHTPWHTGKGRPEQRLSFANGPDCQYGQLKMFM
jgi:hypothetical protein